MNAVWISCSCKISLESISDSETKEIWVKGKDFTSSWFIERSQTLP